MNQFAKIADGLSGWLNFELRCGRKELFRETFLANPLHQLLSYRFPGQVLSEVQHPVLTKAHSGRGKKPAIDFAVQKEDGSYLAVIETKWVSKSPSLLRDIIRDIVRLDLAVPKYADEGFIILAGIKRDIAALFAKSQFQPHPDHKSSKHILPLGNHVKSSVRFVPIPKFRQALYTQVLDIFKHYKISKSIPIERSGPYPRAANDDLDCNKGNAAQPRVNQTRLSLRSRLREVRRKILASRVLGRSRRAGYALVGQPKQNQIEVMCGKITYKEESLEIDENIKISYTWIPSSGYPIVLLHGTSSEWQSFLPHIPQLSKKYDVYALDLRGHGQSSWITNSYHLQDYADDILAFIQKQVKNPVVLYGHSLGALIALLLTSQYPNAVLGLVMSDPPMYFHNLTLDQTVWYEPFKELHHVLSSYHSAGEIEAYMLQQYPNMDLENCKARAKCLSNVDPTVVSMMMDNSYIKGFDIDEVLRKINRPVLLIQGNPELGAALRDEDVIYATERLQQCSVVHMQDVGHSLLPSNLFYKMIDFLDSLHSK